MERQYGGSHHWRKFGELSQKRAEAVMAFVVDQCNRGEPYDKVARRARDRFHLRGG